MVGTPTFVEDPEDTREAIMGATYRALCDHGYADLTIQRIGDEFDKSKSLLYHHYDGKDELLLEFLEFLLERFETSIAEAEVEDPAEHLASLLDHVVPSLGSGGSADFTRAMIELRTQAAHDDDYREHFTRNDRVFRDRLVSVINTGIARGTFRRVDPEAVAAFIQTTVGGAMTGSVTAEEYPAEAVRAELEAYIEERLLVSEELTAEGGHQSG